MARYQVWDKKKKVITPGAPPGESPVHTPEQWLAKYPWADLPGVKMVITADPINGGCAEPFDNFVELRKKQGADIPDDWKEQNKKGLLSDDEILAAIEEFDDNPPDPGPSVEERTAAALEFIALNSLPDEV